MNASHEEAETVARLHLSQAQLRLHWPPGVGIGRSPCCTSGRRTRGRRPGLGSWVTCVALGDQPIARVRARQRGPGDQQSGGLAYEGTPLLARSAARIPCTAKPCEPEVSLATALVRLARQGSRNSTRHAMCNDDVRLGTFRIARACACACCDGAVDGLAASQKLRVRGYWSAAIRCWLHGCMAAGHGARGRQRGRGTLAGVQGGYDPGSRQLRVDLPKVRHPLGPSHAVVQGADAMPTHCVVPLCACDYEAGHGRWAWATGDVGCAMWEANGRGAECRDETDR